VQAGLTERKNVVKFRSDSNEHIHGSR